MIPRNHPANGSMLNPMPVFVRKIGEDSHICGKVEFQAITAIHKSTIEPNASRRLHAWRFASFRSNIADNGMTPQHINNNQSNPNAISYLLMPFITGSGLFLFLCRFCSCKFHFMKHGKRFGKMSHEIFTHYIKDIQQ